MYTKTFILDAINRLTALEKKAKIGATYHYWCFSTAWYGTVQFGTVHFWGVFHWVQYLVPGTFLVPPRPRFQASRTVTKT